VWLPGNRVVRPRAWLSLSGRTQRHPNRNTRGYIGRDGRHHWIDVFPTISGAPNKVTLRSS
jgi:hypothetical protein